MFEAQCKRAKKYSHPAERRNDIEGLKREDLTAQFDPDEIKIIFYGEKRMDFIPSGWREISLNNGRQIVYNSGNLPEFEENNGRTKIADADDVIRIILMQALAQQKILWRRFEAAYLSHKVQPMQALVWLWSIMDFFQMKN